MLTTVLGELLDPGIDMLHCWSTVFEQPQSYRLIRLSCLSPGFSSIHLLPTYDPTSAH